MGGLLEREAGGGWGGLGQGGLATAIMQQGPQDVVLMLPICLVDCVATCYVLEI